MPSRNNIETRVIEVIRSHLHCSNGTIDVRTRFVDDLGADSLALVELTLVFEEAFDIDIPDHEADSIRTVREAISIVEKHVRAGHPAGR